MKKKFIFTASAVVLLFTMNSCKTDVLDYNKTLNFSKQTVEQQKQSIEQNGIDLINKIDAMQTTKAMIALQAFSTNSTGSPVFVKPLAQLRTNLLKNDTKALETFNSQMKVAAQVGDEYWGTWTWNSTLEDFDYVATTNQTVTILFPATENSTTNNGELKITYSQSTIVVPETDPVEYLPKSISVVLKVSGTVALTADYTGSYKTDGTPTKVTQTLVIEKYNWKIELTNDDKDVSAKYAFNFDNDVLLKYEVGAAGSFTATNIESSMNNDKPENIFTSGAMYFQVMNVAVVGGITDFKGFMTEGKALNYSDDKIYYQKEVDIFNKYIKAYGYFVKEKKKFADVEFYLNEYSDTYTTYNPASGNYDLVVTNNWYSAEPRFVLSDKSKVSIEDFVQTGFEDLVKKLESYQNK